ncbi:DNA translocase FtsK 4TM domain-containing protein [Candidatus Albibeggiatoa sp. nov. NOAA]|uniref:DNA translocase FtsK n=1 Tax=Candidatus Albibeggiatoa sp. nov. NOAA TaxID=3162724 RepID=UPI0033017682|nr:DNA translocase FtsK 4TM domain-containing protein [Thiotrichaceae bacterium]
MSQARRTQRFSSNNNNRKIGHGLREILFIFFCFVSLYLLVSLFTYYPGDPSIFYTDKIDGIQNKGGIAGALFADIFYYLFGYFAYLFPIMVGYVGWIIYQGKHHAILAEPRHLVVPGIGFLITISAGCGFAIVHFSAGGMLLPSHAGGVLGSLVGKSLQNIFDQLGATLLLLGLFFTGITLLTGLSWLKLMDTLGFYTLKWTPIVKEFMLRNFWPWVLQASKVSVEQTQKYSKVAYDKAKDGSNTAWHAWQDRRAKWREEREQYEEEYYFEDDRYYDDEYYEEEPNEAQKQPKKPVTEKVEQPEQLEISEVEKDEKPEPVKVEVKKAAVKPEPEPPQIDIPVLDDKVFQLPTLPLLNPMPEQIQDSVMDLNHWLTMGFANIKVEIKIKEVHPGPVLTGFEVETVTPINKMHLDDMATALGSALESPHVQIVETMPGTLGVEIANIKRQPIGLRELLEAHAYRKSSTLNLVLGKNITGETVTLDLARIPHILVAGSYAEEKNTGLHTLLMSLLYKADPELLRLVVVDNEQNDFQEYAELPHLLTPLVKDVAEVPNILKWCVQEMEHRYRIMGECGVRNIESYNKALLEGDDIPFIENLDQDEPDYLPYIVVVISEISELMKTSIGLAAEESITLLTQKSRAAGIHVVLATSEPTVSVITGLIKANIPTRLAFQVTNKSESRTILGQMGAENLLGQGDMLYMTAGTGMPVRVHGCQISDEEVKKVTAYLKAQTEPEYIDLEL